MGLNLGCEQVARAELGEPAKQSGEWDLYHCPHEQRHSRGDRNPSLGINRQNDTWKDFAEGIGGKGGWSLAAFLACVDASDKEKVTAWLAGKGLLAKRESKSKAKPEHGPCVATYIYTDLQGHPVARKLRFEPGANGRKKDFVWERLENEKWVSGLGGVKTPLYRIAKIVNEPFVVLTEGEKDADAGASIGLQTTTSGGVGSRRDDHAEALRDKFVMITPDNDEPGRVEAQRRAASLHGTVASVKIVGMLGYQDLAGAIKAGLTKEDARLLFDTEAEWMPASGAEILDSVLAFLTRFVSMTLHQARAVALWVAHTFALDAADATPYLNVNSAEKQSGKTRLLECLRLLVFNPWFTGRVTAAVLTRKIDSEHPTLLLDESDAAFSGEKEYAEALRGILNTGYRRGGAASCCVGQGVNISYKDFSTYCPKAIAGIGKLSDTVQDHAVPIKLKRATRGTVARFREREAQQEASGIAARLAAWATANLRTLCQARPEIPGELSDRQSDCVEPLLSIADLAGGEWPESARTALVTLCGQAQADDDSIGVKLLRDIRGIFFPRDDEGKASPKIDEIPSGELCEALAKIETSPWGEWYSKPVTPAGLARLLKPFGIIPDRIGDRKSRVRGYAASQFEDAFSLYLPPQGVHPSTTRENSGDSEDLKPSTKEIVDTSENAISGNKNVGSGHVDSLKARQAGIAIASGATQPILIHENKEILEV